MTNGSSLSGPLTSICHCSFAILPLVICHLSRCQLPACSVCPTLGTQDACAPRGTEKNPFPLAKVFRLASISTVPEVLTLRKEDRTATLRIPQSALEIASTEFRNPVTLYRIHHFLPRAVSAV